MNKENKIEFKVGDKVVTESQGNGIVTQVNNELTFPIIVFFNKDNDTDNFLANGKRYKFDYKRYLYHAGAKFHVRGEIVPERMKKVNAYVNIYSVKQLQYAQMYRTEEMANSRIEDSNYVGTFKFTGKIPENIKW